MTYIRGVLSEQTAKTCFRAEVAVDGGNGTGKQGVQTSAAIYETFLTCLVKFPPNMQNSTDVTPSSYAHSAIP